MESVLGRYRNLIILVGVLFLQVLGLAVQVKRGSNEGQDTRLIRIWAVGAVTPFERALLWMENSAGDVWHNYFYLRGLRAENRQLREQIEQMRLEQVRLNEDAAQAHRLQALLAFKEQYVAKTVAAQVIGSSGVDSSRVVYIDKGENAGITRDMAVITADGIVGKVLLVYPSVSQVLLIDDQSSGVGVILGTSRLQGVLVGTASGEVVLNGIMSDEQVPVGEAVQTSGGDQIFPKGLPVGTVTKVGLGKDLFLSIKIKPAANLSKLEEVLVLVEKQERQATADSNVRERAADILAQRLPSVPVKPVADAPTASKIATAAGSTPASATPKPQSPAPLLPKTEAKSQTTSPKSPNAAAPAKLPATKVGTAASPSGQTQAIHPASSASGKDTTGPAPAGAAGASSGADAGAAAQPAAQPKPPIPAPPQPDSQPPPQENSPQ